MQWDAAAGEPRAIGRYLLHNEIASGGMATVHLGWMRESPGSPGSRAPGLRTSASVVAIKRLHPQFAKDPEFVAMFLDEAWLAGRIFHPNVIRVLDVVAHDDELFLVMEYVLGAPLSLLLRRARANGARIPPSIAVGIVRDVLLGLHAAHEAKDDAGQSLNIVHRDVSPQNVMVGRDGVSRVFDFGIAKAAGRLQTSQKGQLKGKLSYMAPEQIDDEAVSPKTDIYAASVVLWESLSGKRLFLASDERGTLAQILAAHVPAPSTRAPGLSPALDHAVLRGLDRTMSNRYETAREMAYALGEYCPPASSEEIGEWVVSLIHDELAATENLIARIEREPTVLGVHEKVRSNVAAVSKSTGSVGSEWPSELHEPTEPHARRSAPSLPSQRRRRVSVLALAALIEITVIAAVAMGAIRYWTFN
jgi:serine/threonine-protein kinase